MARVIRATSEGHRLVLVEGGTHFNLRSSLANGGGPLRGLILAWFSAASQAPAGSPPQLPPDGWGSCIMPLRDVTKHLPEPANQP